MKKSIIGILIIMAIWFLITLIFNPPSYLFPSLVNTIKELLSNYQLFIHHTLITLSEIILGFIVALIIGLILSLVSLYYRKTETVYIANQELDLSEKLFSLIEYLVVNKDILLLKKQIFDNICGYNSKASIEILEVYMSRLRRELKAYGYDKYIVTKRGRGYILKDNIKI